MKGSVRLYLPSKLIKQPWVYPQLWLLQTQYSIHLETPCQFQGDNMFMIMQNLMSRLLMRMDLFLKEFSERGVGHKQPG